MAITLQARQADGTWAVRNAFKTENAKVISGSMTVSELEAVARRLMGQWQSTMQDVRQLRVHNSANDPKPDPTARKRSERSETAARALGWMTNLERHGIEDVGVVHPNGHWAADWASAVAFHDGLEAAAARRRQDNQQVA